MRLQLADDDHASDKEIEIIHDLGQQVLSLEKMLNLASDICGELDWSGIQTVIS